MHRLTHDIVSAKRKRNITHPAGDLCPRTLTLDSPCCFDEIYRVIVVLFDTGRHGENVRIKNNIFRRKANLFGQQTKGPFANVDLVIDFDRLS